MRNPFRDTIVADPWNDQCADVPAIHYQVFEQCLQGLEHVRSMGRSTALMIHGEAGSGKTHLLSRLRAHLTPRAPVATDRPECLFVWIRLQTSPRMIWRTLRRTLVEDWFRPIDGHRCQFDRILFHRLAEIRVAEGDLEPWYEYMLDEAPEGLQDLMERIAASLDLDRNTAVAFEHIAFRRHRRDLRAWLSGDSLPDAALERLDLSQDEGTDEEREDEAQRVVCMLCRLAGRRLPVLLSFDQVEALQMSPDDTEGLFAFGKLVSTLHDETSNVLIVSCVQSAFHTMLKDRSREADHHRMTSFGSRSLDPLTRIQAEVLIAARLTCAGPECALPPERPGCWPLDAQTLDDLYSQPRPVTPRRLLGLCAEHYELWQASKTAQPESATGPGQSPALTTEVRKTDVSAADTAAEFLEETWRTAVEEKLSANRPERTEDIVRHGLPLLLRLTSPELRLVTDEQHPDVSLVFADASSRIGISLCLRMQMTSLAAQLKRLKSGWNPSRLQRLVLVRDSRVPLSSGAKKAKLYLEELEQQGAAVVYPTKEVLAALDALRELLSDAKSGDLACGGETIGPQTVEEWLRKHLTDGLQDFVDDVLGRSVTGSTTPTSSDTGDLEALQALLSTRPVIPLADASQSLDRSTAQLEHLVRRHPGQFGLLGGATPVVFREVDTGSTVSPRSNEV